MRPAGLGSTTAWGEVDDPNAWSIAAVPLPASLPLLLAALGGFALVRRKSA